MSLFDRVHDDIPFGPGDQETKEIAKPLLVGLTIAVVALLVGVAISVYACRSTPSFSVETSKPEKEKEAAAVQETLIFVHVVGSVANPGVYALPEGSHVVDAIESAGGFTEDADTGSLNLARTATDGEQIRVSSVTEAKAQAEGKESPGIDASGKVNINLASADELQTISGIGEVTAKRIVEDREKNGPFTSVDDLTRVSGIGEKTVAKMRDSLTV